MEKKDIIPAWFIAEFAAPSKDLAWGMHFSWLHYTEVSHKYKADLAVQQASREPFLLCLWYLPCLLYATYIQN